MHPITVQRRRISNETTRTKLDPEIHYQDSSQIHLQKSIVGWPNYSKKKMMRFIFAAEVKIRWTKETIRFSGVAPSGIIRRAVNNGLKSIQKKKRPVRNRNAAQRFIKADRCRVPLELINDVASELDTLGEKQSLFYI